MKLDPSEIIAIIKELEPHFIILLNNVEKELQRRITPELINTKYAAHLLGLKSESTLIKRKQQGKYNEGWHYISKKDGKLSWHRDRLLLEEFQKSKGSNK
jgi:hypothetical protein